MVQSNATCVTLSTTESQFVAFSGIARDADLISRGLLEFLLPGEQRGVITVF